MLANKMTSEHAHSFTCVDVDHIKVKNLVYLPPRDMSTSHYVSPPDTICLHLTQRAHPDLSATSLKWIDDRHQGLCHMSAVALRNAHRHEQIIAEQQRRLDVLRMIQAIMCVCVYVCVCVCMCMYVP